MAAVKKKVGIVDYVGLKGGNHYYSLCLLDALAKKGCETYLLSNLTQGLNNEDIHITKTFDLEIDRSFSGLYNLLTGSIKACRILRKNKVKTIIFHLFEASYITLFVLGIFKLFGLKVIGIAHDVTSFEKNELKRIRDYTYQRQIDHIVVHNHFSYEFLKKLLPPKTRIKTSIIKHGGHSAVIDRSIDQKEAKEALGLDPKVQYVLFFGQIKKVKGLDILLNGFPLDQANLKLIIAGKPWKDDFKIYRDIIEKREMSHQIHAMIKYISEKERDLLYNAADFIVLPYREIFQSGVLLMAMSYGLPIIASDLEANKEVLSAEDGLLFESENLADLKQKIELLNADPDLRKSFSEQGLKKIKNEYSWDRISEDYLPLIH